MLSSVNEHSGAIFFLTRPIGIGKTYVYNTIVIKIWSWGKIAICVASCSIVVFFVDGGWTTHSIFI